MSAPLTKKEQKALAFRAKQKAKKADLAVPPDLPEQDEPEGEGGEEQEERGVDAHAPTIAEASTSKNVASSETVKGKEKKRKTAWDDDEVAEKGEGKKSRKDGKQRFILFVGNLGFKTTKEEVQKHFEEAVGSLPSVRLLTTKPTPQQPTPKSRGIAFLELPSSSALQAALKLHHSSLKGREINVELTAGGGGGGEGRKRKIAERNSRVGEQREKRAEREAEAEAEGGDETVEGGRGAAGEKEEGGEGKARMRGGRRVKAKPSQGSSTAGPSAKRSKSDADGALSGWASRRPGVSADADGNPAGRPPARVRQAAGAGAGRPYGGGKSQQQNQKKKWQPTGANAVNVG